MEIMFPTGRVIGGDLYKMFPRTDNFGKPKVKADGTPDLQCNFGVAIQKEPGMTHWSQTVWGAQVVEVGRAGYPKEHAYPGFAWKITDGDSLVPNRKGRIPAEQQGYAGHWVIWFSQGWLPKLVSADGLVELGPNAILPGYYVRVLSDVKANAPSPSPGVFVNPRGVALMAEGEVLETMGGVDTSVFATVPAGALPVGARPVAPALPAFALPPTVPALAPPPTVPAPNLAFLQVPPPPVQLRRMTATAGGASYESFIAAGWDDTLLIANGMMLP